MAQTTFVLTKTLGEYDDRVTTIVAISKDKSKLEARRDADIANIKFAVRLQDECIAECHRLELLNPFSEVEPPARLPKPEVPPRTKEEHAARYEAKTECERIHKEWLERKYDHEGALWKKARRIILKQNDVKSKDVPEGNRYYGSAYEYRNISEYNYEVEEVEEI